MSPRPVHLLVTAVLAVGSTLVCMTAAHADPTPVRPAGLARGADPGVPQLLGKTIVDGRRRIEVRGQEVQLLGKSGADYVVAVWRRSGRSDVLRVAPDGTHTTLMDDVMGSPVLSDDGQQVVEPVVRSGSRTVVTVRDAHTGARVARRAFDGYVQVLDLDRGRAVLGASSPSRTLWWRTGSDTTSRISGREGYFADIGADRFAAYTKDPYEGGCSVLAALSARRTTLWRSCRQAVVATSPNGNGLLTQRLLGDGPAATIEVRSASGHLRATYSIDGWFGVGTWEDDRSLLIEADGRSKAAIVRCASGVCERASERVASPVTRG